MKSLGKFALIKQVAMEHEYFPFKQQMYTIYTLGKALNLQVFFEMKRNCLHEWTVQTANNRTMGKFTIFCKN